MYNVFSKRAIIQGLPQLDSILEELALECLNELEPAIGLAEGSTFSRIISIKDAKKKGYFSEKTKEETIRAWIKNGTIPESCVKKIGKKYFLIEHLLLAWILENESKSESKEDEQNINNFKNKEASMWSQPQEKTKRCRLALGTHCYLISDPLRNGKESFRIEYLDSDKRRCYLRLKKSVVKSREQAVSAAEKEISRLEKIGKIANSYSREASIPTAPGDYAICEIAEKFLYAKKRENIRSYDLFKSTIRNRIIPFFGSIPMSKLNLNKLEDYRNMRREKVKDVSIKNDLITLSMIYNFGIKRGIYTGQNPVRIRDINLNIESRERYMTKEEEEKIWKVLDENPLLRDLADFALNTAMRPNNVIGLVWNRILFDEREAFIPAAEHKQKEKAGHYLLNNVVLDLLRRRKEESSDGLVFHLDNGKKVTMKWIQKEWKRACEKAGVEGLHFYDLRHTVLSRLAGNGSNVFILKRISNHSSTASLEKYVKAAGLKEPALEALNGVK